MALTFTLVKGAEAESGRVRELVYDIRLDAAYPTGGYTINPREVGMINVLSMTGLGAYLFTGLPQTTAVIPQYDPLLKKFQVFVSGAAGAVFPEQVPPGAFANQVIRMRILGV